MAVPTNKEELLKAINTAYDKLKKELSTIPGKLTTLQELEGHPKGTFMSVNNLVSYLVGWGVLVLRWNRRMIQFNTASPYANVRGRIRK